MNRYNLMNNKQNVFFHLDQLSGLNGEAGKPSLLYKFAFDGLSAQAYRTYMGSAIESFHRITLLESILAKAQTNFLSAPAIAKCPGASPSLVINPPLALSNE